MWWFSVDPITGTVIYCFCAVVVSRNINCVLLNESLSNVLLFKRYHC